jgi:hypothetical protein
LAEFAIDVDERILPRFFGFFLVAANLKGKAVHEVFVLVHQLCECPVVAPLRLADEREIVRGRSMCACVQTPEFRLLLELLEFV